MARTKSFKALVERNVKGDKKFAEALLREGIDAMLGGDLDTGKAIMRDYIKATRRLREARRGDRRAAQEPDPHVRSARQSAGQKSVQRHRLSAKTRRYAFARRGVARNV